MVPVPKDLLVGKGSAANQVRMVSRVRKAMRATPGQRAFADRRAASELPETQDSQEHRVRLVQLDPTDLLVSRALPD